MKESFLRHYEIMLMIVYYGIISLHLSYGLSFGVVARTHILPETSPFKKRAVSSNCNTSMQRVCRPALKIPKRFTLPFHFGDVSLFSCRNAIISQKIVHVSYGRDSHWTGKHRTIVHERLPSQVGVHFVNKLYQNCHNARAIQISFENHGWFPTQYG